MARPGGRRSAPCFAVHVNGQETPIEVRRSPRARRFTLRVNEAQRGVVLTMPLSVSLKEAGDFLTRHEGWLQGRLAALPEPVPFTDGIVLPLRDTEHLVRFVGTARGRGVVWTESAPARGLAPMRSPLPRICVAGPREHAPRRLLDWLKREARKDLSARVTWHAGRLGLAPKRVSVRDQSSRWGSCSSAGSLSFSWRLILAPCLVLDYVAAHEVAHLKEMNHGPRFWQLVRRTMPRYEEARSWLRRHGGGLHRFGVDT